jgi:ribosomal protein L20
MPRSVNAVASRASRKRILKQAKGFYGKRKNVYTVDQKRIGERSSISLCWSQAEKNASMRTLWIARKSTLLLEKKVLLTLSSSICFPIKESVLIVRF